MSCYPQSFDVALAKMIQDMKDKRPYALSTLEFYDSTCKAVYSIMIEAHCETMPWKLTEPDIKKILAYLDDNRYAIVTRKGYLHCLSTLCKFYDNRVIDSMRITWPYDNRPNVDWLDEDQIHKLLAIPKTPIQEFSIHCMLQLGMRRIEVLRLRIKDLHDKYITAWGKGPQGGKPRDIPYHPQTEAVLGRFLRYREGLIAEAKKRRPATTVVPDQVVLWYKAGVLSPYDEDGYGLDKVVIIPLRKKLGFHFSNHTLRRTFGRMMWRYDVPVITISKLLGHEDTSVTMRYIGVDIDDMASAMKMCPF